MFRPRSRTLIALLLSIVAASSAAQTAGVMPRLVSAENTLTLQLFRAPTSTEPSSATGTVQVNLQSGQVRIELKQATPSSDYIALFATSATNIQLGTITTDTGGEGSSEATLGAGNYLGLFQITRGGILQFITADTSLTLTATSSLSVTGSASTTVTSTQNSTSQTTTTSQITSTSTETNTNQTTTSTGPTRVQVDPPLRTITAGAFAKFNINIRANQTANVLLAARAVPPHSVAIFTQNLGVANPEFHSTLTIVTSTDTPVGTYGITLIALISGQEFDSQIGLEVIASSTPTTSQTTSVTAGAGFSIAMSTERHSYQQNATVSLQGHVTDDSGSAVTDASVSVQVDGPTGAEIVFLSSLKTDAAGVFQVSFKLPASATAGTYTAFATATKGGFAGATTHTTFVVGTSSTPSVVIKDVYATDMSGTRTATFSAGQTVLVWVVVENSGATFEGVIWVQIRDPNGTPVWIQLQISQLGTGQTIKVAFGFAITANMASGLYTANTLVSDKLISQGGTFLASANTEFALTV